MSSMFWIQLLAVLVILFFAARKSGIALGLIGGIGVVMFVFGFGLAPGKPPIDVMLVMLSVVCAGAALQASGGLDMLCYNKQKNYFENILVM